jgi:hypothetical protein
LLRGLTPSHSHGDLLSEPLGALWLTASPLAVIRRRYALGGLLLAAALLTRANLLVLIPLVAVLLGKRHGALFAVAALVPVGLWSLNVSAPVSTGGGSAFFVGTFLPGDATLVATRHPDRDRDAALRAEAWRNLRTYPREAPAAYAAMVSKKLPRLWLKPSPRSDGLRATPLRIWHALIVLAAFAGLLLAGNRLVAGALLAFTLLHLVVEAIPRYALPALPVLIAAGTAGWFSWLAARRAPRTRPATPDWPVSPAPPPARPASPSRSA